MTILQKINLKSQKFCDITDRECKIAVMKKLNKLHKRKVRKDVQ